jgi:hypothetical protein
MLRMLTGSVLDLAPFVSDLREMVCKEAFGSPLALRFHPPRRS